MKTKICGKCKKELDVCCFGLDKSSSSGLCCYCKNCRKQQYNESASAIKKQKKQYYVDNIDKIKKHTQHYREENRENLRQYSKKYYKNNTKLISRKVKHYRKNNQRKMIEQNKHYYETNIEKILEQKRQYYLDNINNIKQYREHNAERIKQYNKQYQTFNSEQKRQTRTSNSKFDGHQARLCQFENIRRCPEKPELLEVRCAYCGKWMKPTNTQVHHRLQVFNGTLSGELRFYCSENCRMSCPIYNQNKYPKGFKKATSREVVPLLRQLVLERDGHTCQKCGATTETAQLHVHHEKSYTLNKIMANDPDNCITLCKECHKWIHSQDGCRYVDLTC
jgi:hypothetical protein